MSHATRPAHSRFLSACCSDVFMIEEIKGFLGEDWLRYRDDLSESLSSDIPLLEALKSATVQESAEVLQMVRDGRVAEVTAFVRSRNGLESAQKVLSRESSLAAAALEPLADSKAKEYLILLALNLSERNV